MLAARDRGACNVSVGRRPAALRCAWRTTAPRKRRSTTSPRPWRSRLAPQAASGLRGRPGTTLTPVVGRRTLGRDRSRHWWTRTRSTGENLTTSAAWWSRWPPTSVGASPARWCSATTAPSCRETARALIPGPPGRRRRATAAPDLARVPSRDRGRGGVEGRGGQDHHRGVPVGGRRRREAVGHPGRRRPPGQRRRLGGARGRRGVRDDRRGRGATDGSSPRPSIASMATTSPSSTPRPATSGCWPRRSNGPTWS